MKVGVEIIVSRLYHKTARLVYSFTNINTLRTIMAAVHGACLCGGITVEIHGTPETVMQCYCDHCQMNASAPFQIV